MAKPLDDARATNQRQARVHPQPTRLSASCAERDPHRGHSHDGVHYRQHKRGRRESMACSKGSSLLPSAQLLEEVVDTDGYVLDLCVVKTDQIVVGLGSKVSDGERHATEAMAVTVARSRDRRRETTP